MVRGRGSAACPGDLHANPRLNRTTKRSVLLGVRVVVVVALVAVLTTGPGPRDLPERKTVTV
jgi:hypothetical protein